MKPLGASGAWRGVVAAGLHAAALGGLDDHLGAVDVAGDDVAAGVDQRVGGLRLAHRQRPVAGEDHLHGGVRVGLAGAEQHRVDVGQHRGDRLGGDEADLVRLGGQAGGDAVDEVGLVEIAEIAAGVLRVGILVPQRRGVAELDVGVLLGHVDHERRVVAERGGEDQPGAVELDHRFHRLGDGVGLRHVLFLDDGDAGHLLQRFGGDRVGLVPAVVVARADVDDADGEVGGARRAHRHDAGGDAERAEGGAPFQKLAARKNEVRHPGTP